MLDIQGGADHSRTRQGKGLEGTDAALFDRDSPVDRQAFIQCARQDGHQRHGMVSLAAGDRGCLQETGVFINGAWKGPIAWELDGVTLLVVRDGWT